MRNVRAGKRRAVHKARQAQIFHESLGGDVEKTLELYFNERLLWGREGHMPEYMLLVGGLMQK